MQNYSDYQEGLTTSSGLKNFPSIMAEKGVSGKKNLEDEGTPGWLAVQEKEVGPD